MGSSRPPAKNTQKKKAGSKIGKSHKDKQKLKSDLNKKIHDAEAMQNKFVQEANTRRQRLNEIKKLYGDGQNPEFEGEYLKLKRAVEQDGDRSLQNELQMKQYTEEQEDIDRMDVVTISDDDDSDTSDDDSRNASGFFVPGSGNSDGPTTATGPPKFTFTDPENQLVDSIENDKPVESIENAESTTENQDPEDLLTSDQMMIKLGITGDEKVEGWKKVGWGEEVLVQYGPRNASRYELKPASSVVTGYDKGSIPDLSDRSQRLGLMKAGNRFVYDWRHFKAIQGVAWKHGGAENPLRLLLPKQENEKRTYKPVLVRVKWEKDGQVEKSWEDRATVQRIFGKDNRSIGDNAIYEAATSQERRYQEWADGKRDPKDRSPTPNPEVAKLLDPERLRQGSSEPPEPNPTLKSAPTTGKSPMLEFKEEWCELNGVEVSDLQDAAAQVKFLAAWGIEKERRKNNGLRL